MTTPTLSLHPSSPLESNKNDDLEHRVETKLNDINMFKYSINNVKELITCFEDKIHISKKKIQSSYLNIGISRHRSTTTCVAPSVATFGLVVVSVSAGIS